ncbi:MAG: VOC family protein [Sphingomonadaceae bacterium]|uniref:VOC family protein n=1 Tax=Thermaurantiacus sp. TaxID=2820283 RepID=UPI00298F3DBA|nr:VOC family protein [Thermaurantiacus sp.]MCS6986597.1 VOC family protein [Sphingomonadaceae bacterium]MDW8414142.1 VOC family protein [Thermaurantiacus sp.]
MSDFGRPKGASSALSYRDPKAACRFLEAAFGFELVFAVLDDADNLLHSELRFGASIVMVGGEWDDHHRSPASLGGVNTQSVHLQLAQGEDIDAHCARARAAGAEILAAPEDQFYGDRVYRARDPEGHVWTVGVTVRDMTAADWDAAGAVRTVTCL